MIAYYNFGRDFTYEFHVNDASGAPIDLTDAEHVSTHVFDHKPARDVAVAGTGALQTVSSWVVPEGEKFAQLSIEAIDDPEPNSEFRTWEYFIAVNFKFAASEQVQTIIKELKIERVTSQQSATDVGYADVLKHFPLLDRYFSNVNDITNLIEVSEEEIRVYLSAAGFGWAQIWHPKALHSAVKFKTLSNICLMQSIDSGDEWERKHSEYRLLYQNVIESTKLEYDVSKSGEAGTVHSKPSYQRIIR